jgi:copper oxidase (laccase) domain-containing protein
MEFWIYRDSRNRFDFWAIALDQLTAAGLDPKNVQIAEICSKCQPDFYSHRRGDQDRFAFFAGVD